LFFFVNKQTTIATIMKKAITILFTMLLVFTNTGWAGTFPVYRASDLGSGNHTLTGIEAKGANGANTLYVDASSMQNGTGQFTDPFKTIQLAVNAAVSGDSIVIRKGVYREQVLLSKGNLTIVPYGNEEVTISGAEPVTGWTSAGGNIYKAYMPWNITENDYSNQVFCDGKMLELTRWPKNTGTTVMPSNAFSKSVTTDLTNYFFNDADLQEPSGKWNGCEIWVNLSRTNLTGNGWDGQGWTGKIVSNQAGKVVVSGMVSGRIGDEPWGLGENTEYFLFNPSETAVKTYGISSYLQPGEWWKKGDTLFVYTPDGSAPSETPDGLNLIEAKKRINAIAFSSQSNIRIKGLTVFAGTINTDYPNFFNRTSSVCNSSNILIDGIKARYVTHFTNQAKDYQMQWVQRSGFIISGSNITIQNCEIQYSAGSAVSVIGRGNKILNNKIWDVNYSSAECGAMNTGLQYNPGLVISEDHEIGYNTIYNTPQQGINIRAIVNSSKTKPGAARIHHNVIHDFMLKTHDSGSLDTYNSDGKWLRADHNVIYNSNLFLTIGFYLDFGTNYIVDHNLFYNLDRPVQLNYGGWGPTTPSDIWTFNNTAMADRLSKPGIFNGAGSSFANGFRILNNITSAKIYTSYPGPLVIDNFNPGSETDMLNFFANPASQDYSLALGSPAIDTCYYAPFNDKIENKPDAGCFESGAAAWQAGAGTMTSHFLISDSAFTMQTNYGQQKTWSFPVFVLPYSGFSGNVDLSLVKLPEGFSVQFSSNTVLAGQSVTMSITASNTLAPGFHIVRLVASSGEITDTRYYTIEVKQEVGTIEINSPVSFIPYYTIYQFSATAFDQVGNRMRYQPLLTWSCKGGGSISTAGKYKASEYSDSVEVYVKFGYAMDSCVFKVADFSSIGDQAAETETLKIIPTPAKGKAYLEFTSDFGKDIDLSILTIKGSLVKHLKSEVMPGKNRLELNLNELKPGIYLVRLRDKNRIRTAKLVVAD